MLAPEQSMLRASDVPPLDCCPENGVKPNDVAVGVVAATIHIERNIP
jgi:hypothetical protein